MEEFKFARDEVQKKAEERREKIREQVMEARENRSVIFNPGTGRFEKYEQKEEGFKLPGFYDGFESQTESNQEQKSQSINLPSLLLGRPPPAPPPMPIPSHPPPG
ncbi:hypothetical protein THAOC_01672 [Thalassiosira oceanica]|uniref:Uncharacterized protein n=1 Tax=Thalassiosira oceanica TaxID=159749 RepID=K0TQS6_THAOC|nr:hypothetical protein THAOC_01672 [Thalassiosira oceanica]|eukprot:EJK76562.1 hypothetical protein THAOC_01672 [Thalassiosira oceanica]